MQAHNLHCVKSNSENCLIIKALYGSTDYKTYISSTLYFLVSLLFLFYSFINIYKLIKNTSPFNPHIFDFISTENLILGISALFFSFLILSSFISTLAEPGHVRFKKRVYADGETIYSVINNGLYFVGGIFVIIGSILMLLRRMIGYVPGNVTEDLPSLKPDTIVLYIAQALIVAAIILSILSFIEPRLTEPEEKKPCTRLNTINSDAIPTNIEITPKKIDKDQQTEEFFIQNVVGPCPTCNKLNKSHEPHTVF